MSRVIRTGIRGALACALVLMCGIVRAEEDRLVQARALFEEGRTLVERGVYEEGCRRFDQSLKLEPGMGTEFNLADCWERIGRIASAQALFEKVAGSARTRGLRDRERIAHARARALEPRLARLVIDANEQKGLKVFLDGKLLDASVLGAAIPVDPGSYQVAATLVRAGGAESRELWSRRVKISGTEGLVLVSVPPLRVPKAETPSASEDRESEEVKGAEEEAVESKPGPARAESASRPLPKGPNTLPWIIGLGSLGAAGIAAGTAFAFQFQDANDKATAVCGSGPPCNEADLNRHGRYTSDARAARTRLFIGFGVGGAALVSAALIYLTGSSSGSKSGGVQATPVVIAGGSSFGLGAEGSF